MAVQFKGVNAVFIREAKHTQMCSFDEKNSNYVSRCKKLCEYNLKKGALPTKLGLPIKLDLPRVADSWLLIFSLN